MKNRIAIIIIISILSICAVAQDQVDTLKVQELDEVVVEAKMQRTSVEKSIYTPSDKQRNSAQNAIDLLRQMAIPQIRINPIDDTVTDNVGGNLDIYINFLKASKEEMEGLRTADVRRIEYLEFPTDPRFRGAERVINIIVQEYAYGGYTKLTASENVLTGLYSNLNIFSKFTFKKMTYDLYAGANNVDKKHYGNNTEGIYRLTDSDGQEYYITRKETLESSHYKLNRYPITFRATYNSDKIQIRNLLGFTNSGIPTNEYSGKLEYSHDSFNEYSFERKNPSRSNTVAYSGTYFFVLPKDFSIDFSPSFNYTHSNDYTDYAVINQSEIYRHAIEDAYNYRLNLYIRKKLGQKHSLMLGGFGGDYINRLEYTGDNVYKDKFNSAFASVIAGYNFQTRKLSMSLDAGIIWENSNINGQKIRDVYPCTHINVRYVPNQKNSLSVYFQYATASPGISKKSSDILQDNELMYITGNPLLKDSRHTTVYTTYTWIPSNAFSINAYGRHFGLYNRSMLIYSPYDNGKALVRSYINDGNYMEGEIGLAVNWKLLDGNLQFYANPRQSFYKSTGIYNETCNHFCISVQAIYYLKDFFFQAFYMSPQKSMDSSKPQITESRNLHSLIVGWANANWYLHIMFGNFFNKGWEGSTTTTVSPYYSEQRTVIDTFTHPRINFTATYTFGYGKKIQHGNEVGEQSDASSAIMK